MTSRVFGFISAHVNSFEWSHQVYQDYFAAMRMTYAAPPPHKLRSMVHDVRRWDGVLTVGIAPAPVAEQIVKVVAEADLVRAGLLLGGASSAVSVSFRNRIAKELFELIGSEEDDVRRVGETRALGATAGSIVPELLLNIVYSRQVGGTRKAAAEILVRDYAEMARAAAYSSLADKARGNRVHSVLMLSMLEEPNVTTTPVWVEIAVADSTPEVTGTAMKMIGEMKLCGALPVVAETLRSHPHMRARLFAAKTIRACGGEQYAELLADRAVSDPESRVRFECLVPLRHLPIEGARRWLGKVIDEATDVNVKQRAEGMLQGVERHAMRAAAREICG